MYEKLCSSSKIINIIPILSNRCGQGEGSWRRPDFEWFGPGPSVQGGQFWWSHQHFGTAVALQRWQGLAQSHQAPTQVLRIALCLLSNNLNWFPRIEEKYGDIRGTYASLVTVKTNFHVLQRCTKSWSATVKNNCMRSKFMERFG